MFLRSRARPASKAPNLEALMLNEQNIQKFHGALMIN
jgi:hypothetical protein